MDAAVYLRISRDQAGEALGVERQREDCLKLCTQRGWTPHVYEDNDFSASTAKKRPAYTRMLEDIKAGRIQAIVCWRPDRLYRRLRDLLDLMDIVGKHNVPIATVQVGEIDMSTDGGRLIATILGAVAQNEVEVKAARQKRAMKQRAERGIGWGGRAFGYAEDDKHLNRKEANAIRKAYQAIIEGDSLRSIATRWNDAGFRTTKGNMWRGTVVRDVLLNPRYAGLRAHNKVIVGEARWPAIVDREVFDTATAVLRNPSRRMNTSKERKHLLSGLVLCGVCGKPLSIGGGRDRKAYVCKRSECSRVSRDKRSLDEAVTKVVTKRLAQPDVIDLLSKPKPDIRPLYEELAVKQKKLEQIALDYADDVLTREQARTATERVGDRVREIESQIASTASDHTLDDFDASDPEGWFEGLPLSRKRAIIDMLVEITAVSVGKGWRRSQRTTPGLTFRWRVEE